MSVSLSKKHIRNILRPLHWRRAVSRHPVSSQNPLLLGHLMVSAVLNGGLLSDKGLRFFARHLHQQRGPSNYQIDDYVLFFWEWEDQRRWFPDPLTKLLFQALPRTREFPDVSDETLEKYIFREIKVFLELSGIPKQILPKSFFDFLSTSWALFSLELPLIVVKYLTERPRTYFLPASRQVKWEEVFGLIIKELHPNDPLHFELSQEGSPFRPLIYELGRFMGQEAPVPSVEFFPFGHFCNLLLYLKTHTDFLPLKKILRSENEALIERLALKKVFKHYQRRFVSRKPLDDFLFSPWLEKAVKAFVFLSMKAKIPQDILKSKLSFLLSEEEMNRLESLAIKLPHFPSRHEAVVMLNWTLTNLARLQHEAPEILSDGLKILEKNYVRSRHLAIFKDYGQADEVIRYWQFLRALGFKKKEIEFINYDLAQRSRYRARWKKELGLNWNVKIVPKPSPNPKSKATRKWLGIRPLKIKGRSAGFEAAIAFFPLLQV